MQQLSNHARWQTTKKRQQSMSAHTLNCALEATHKHKQQDISHILDNIDFYEKIKNNLHQAKGKLQQKKFDIEKSIVPLKQLIQEISNQLKNIIQDIIQQLQQGKQQKININHLENQLLNIQKYGFNQIDDQSLNNLINIPDEQQDLKIYKQLEDQANSIILNAVKIKEWCIQQVQNKQQLSQSQKINDPKYQKQYIYDSDFGIHLQNCKILDQLYKTLTDQHINIMNKQPSSKIKVTLVRYDSKFGYDAKRNLNAYLFDSQDIIMLRDAQKIQITATLQPILKEKNDQIYLIKFNDKPEYKNKLYYTKTESFRINKKQAIKILENHYVAKILLEHFKGNQQINPEHPTPDVSYSDLILMKINEHEFILCEEYIPHPYAEFNTTYNIEINIQNQKDDLNIFLQYFSYQSCPPDIPFDSRMVNKQYQQTLTQSLIKACCKNTITNSQILDFQVIFQYMGEQYKINISQINKINVIKDNQILAINQDHQETQFEREYDSNTKIDIKEIIKKKFYIFLQIECILAKRILENQTILVYNPINITIKLSHNLVQSILQDDIQKNKQRSQQIQVLVITNFQKCHFKDEFLNLKLNTRYEANEFR